MNKDLNILAAELVKQATADERELFFKLDSAPAAEVYKELGVKKKQLQKRFLESWFLRMKEAEK